MFWRSALKIQTVCFSETSVSIYLSARPHGVRTQQNVDIFAAMRSSNLCWMKVVSPKSSAVDMRVYSIDIKHSPVPYTGASEDDVLLTAYLIFARFLGLIFVKNINPS
jgi:hypothetical protein